MSTRFCPICYERIRGKIEEAEKDPRVSVDRGAMVFDCKIPRYLTDHNGLEMVQVRECSTGMVIEIPKKEFERRKKLGEWS
jgi:hypothetical protein